MITAVLARAREPSTTLFYSYKWNVFTNYARSRSFVTTLVTLDTLLTFLLHLFKQGLTHPTLKVYTVAFVAH